MEDRLRNAYPDLERRMNALAESDGLLKRVHWADVLLAVFASSHLPLGSPGSSRSRSNSIFRNFLDAVRSRERESLAQEIYSGHVASAMCHAGHVSWRTGKKLRFDPKTETFDDREANQYLGREHRKGFELPVV